MPCCILVVSDVSFGHMLVSYINVMESMCSEVHASLSF